MNAERLLELFERVGEAPGAVERLRGLVLDLAVHGRLHTQQNLSRRSTRAAGGRESAPDVPSRAFPHGWRLVPISKLADGGGLFTDGDWVESKDQDPAGDVRLIQLADVGHGEYRDRSARFMRSEVANRMGCTLLRLGDVLVARMPEPIGRACIFPGDSKPAVTVVDVVVLRIERSDVVPRYVVYALNSPSMLRQAMARAAGATRSRISKGNLGSLLFALPPVAEQRAIIARVDELMSLCDQLEAAQVEREKRRNQVVSASLQRLREPVDEPAVFREHAAFHLRHMGRMTTRVEHVRELREAVLAMAVRGMLSTHRKKNTATALLEKIAGQMDDAARLGRIKRREAAPPVLDEQAPYDLPAGWCWARFQCVAAIQSNLVDPRAHLTLPLIAPDNIESATGKLLPYDSTEDAEVRSGKHRFFPGVLLYSKIRPALKKVVSVDFEGLCSADMYPILPFVNRRYLQIFMLSDVFLLQSVAQANRVAMPKINQEALNQIAVAVPPMDEQEEIVERVDELLAYCDQMAMSLGNMNRHRATLLNAVIDATMGAAPD